jgi:hypothetical protein
LDLGKANWVEWERTLTLVARQSGLHPWLDGSISLPNESISPDAHWVWMQNDDTLSAFMLSHVSTSDLDHAASCKTAHELFCLPSTTP